MTADLDEVKAQASAAVKELNQACRGYKYLPYVLWAFEPPVRMALRRVNWLALTADVKDCGPIDYDKLTKIPVGEIEKAT